MLGVTFPFSFRYLQILSIVFYDLENNIRVILKISAHIFYLSKLGVGFNTMIIKFNSSISPFFI